VSGNNSEFSETMFNSRSSSMSSSGSSGNIYGLVDLAPLTKEYDQMSSIMNSFPTHSMMISSSIDPESVSIVLS